MNKQNAIIDEKAAILAEVVKQQFIKVGEEAKQHLLDSLKTMFENDVNSMKSVAQQNLIAHGQQIKNQLYTALNASIAEHFGGSIVGSMMHDLVVPSVFHGVPTDKIATAVQNFKETANQGFLDLGNSISRSGSRNG